MIDDRLQLLYLANCGVLVRWGGRAILLDGLPSDATVFDPLPKTAEQLLLDGCDPYSRIDLLVFSHLHFDHFDLDKTLRFMENHPETTLLAPSNLMDVIDRPESRPSHFGGAALLRSRSTSTVSPGTVSDSSAAGPAKTSEAAPSQLENDLPSGCESDFTPSEAKVILRGRTVLMDDPSWDSPGRFSCGDIRVSFLRTAHITFDYSNHYCMLFSCGPHSLLFTGDMDFSALAPLADAFSLRNQSHLTAFFNPIFLGKQKWVAEAASWNPERVFIYHLPSASIDEHGYRRAALLRAPRYRELLPQLQLLTGPMTVL